MKRTYGPASLVALGVVAVGWAALAMAQTPQAPQPAPAPVHLPTIQNGVPMPPPVMPVTPGTVPVPAPVAPIPTPVPPTPPAGAPAPTAPMPTTPMPTTPAPTAAPIPTTPAATPVTPAAALITGQPAADGALENVGPTGRQEPAVSVEWAGPVAAKVGQPNDYAVIVRNTCNVAVQQVLVRVRLAGAASVLTAEPKPMIEDNVLSWDVGTLQPKEEKALRLRLAAAARGDIAAQAWVTFTGATAMKVKVREPKLAVKAVGPDKVLVGDPAAFTLTVTNPGDGPCENVRVAADLSPGLDHPRGAKVEFPLGNLGPNESRSVQVVCLTKAGGEQSCTATAECDGGLRSVDRLAFPVSMPRLDVEAKGPKLRYVDRKAVYTIKVTNPGDAPASNVTVADVLPAGFKFVTADGGGQHDGATRTVSWFLGEVGPGQMREVNVEVMCVATGEFAQKVAAQASRGLKVEGEAATRVEGLSALQVEVSDLEDPVEVNGEVVYEVRVTNTGSVTETDVKVVCTLPAEKVAYKSATGPTAVRMENGELAFDPLPRLAPKADAVYKVTLKCAAAGTVHFKARATSAGVTEPVSKEESTRIYAD
ncbi:MAG TPA: hypothetical protein VGF55_20035 [Gemmataceae bacterium]|jgi:uncharacterized repeat protein (TIGR01451 family)